MKIIIFAGGTGKRFWPVSRKSSPKQFLPIVNDKPLLRLRYEVLKQGFKDEDIFISTGVQYEKEVKSIVPELPERNIILEPEMRDTGPAVSLAVNYVDTLYPGELISVQWSDHLIKRPDIFINSLREAEKIANTDNKMTLIAVPARFPSPHRGYIQFGDLVKSISEGLDLHRFVKFVEKPTKEVAESYINDGHYGWNPGYWNLTAAQYNSKLQISRPEMYKVIKEIRDSNFDKEVMEQFRTLEKISADYAFAEYLEPQDAEVLLTDMGWSDVGEWIAFKEALEDASNGNVVNGHSFDMGSSDTLIYNTQSDKLVATIGLEGMIVVNTPDVLAVFHKDDNTRIKEFLKKMEEEGFDKYL